MSQDIFIGLALDRSGSMAHIWEPTLSAINEFKNAQSQVEGNAWMTIVTFDDVIETPYYAWNTRDIPDLSTDFVHPRNMTALLDAVGDTIHSQEKWLSENYSWFKGSVLTVVQTDGLENKSHRYTTQQIADLIRQKEEAGWVFVYLGANQDAWAVGQTLGVKDRFHTRTYTASAAGVKDSYNVLSTNTTNLRSGVASAATFDMGSEGGSGSGGGGSSS